MKRLVCICLICLSIVGLGSAYIINFEAPDTQVIGEPYILTGTSTLPPGFSTEVTLYTISPRIREIERKTLTIQTGGSWSVEFDTTGLNEGDYKVEIEEKSFWDEGQFITYSYGSNSDTLKIFKLIDRSDELIIVSPLLQDYNGFIDISGRIEGLGASGIELTVSGPEGIIFGPEYIATDSEGRFSKKVPITEGGSFDVRFADNKGYIDTLAFTVTGYSTPTVPPTQTPVQAISASASASRDVPAYFVIDTKQGTVEISTSTGVDLILEIIDEDGNRRTLNEQGTVKPEEASFAAKGNELYIKVYPVQYANQVTITIYAKNADTIREDPQAATKFGDQPKETPPQETPVLVVIPIMALIILSLFRKR